ncbi:recombinase family protein [Xanthomonas phaseoli pv. phaseoli]|nr:recombinase family protein [Xanthomonas phaseoli pv. phaseoli]
MTTFVRAYLRASTDEQDAQRARSGLDQFARDRGVRICNYYAENASGARLDRAELFRLLADSRPHDVLLVEDVDRLSRLGRAEWGEAENADPRARSARGRGQCTDDVAALGPLQNEFDARMFGAINDMLLDMLAAIARRDYEQRRQRQAQGIAKAKVAGKYRGRQIDRARYGAINRLLASGSSWSVVQKRWDAAAAPSARPSNTQSSAHRHRAPNSWRRHRLP